MSRTRGALLLFVFATVVACGGSDGGSGGSSGSSAVLADAASYESMAQDADSFAVETETTEIEEIFEAAEEPPEAAEELTPVIPPLHAMTFNIRNGMANDGPDAWMQRKELVVETVVTSAPDVMGTQEAWIFQIDYMNEELPAYEWVGESRRGDIPDEYCAIFYRVDDFEVLETDTFWLSDTPEVPGTKFSDTQCCPRIVTWARMKRLVDDEVFVAINTHYGLNNEVRVKSSELLRERLPTIAAGDPVIVLGDFNATPDSEPWTLLTEASPDGSYSALLDTWLEVGLPEAGTFHGFSGTATGARIDWILHSPDLATTNTGIIHHNQANHWPSDHFPVFAEIEL